MRLTALLFDARGNTIDLLTSAIVPDVIFAAYETSASIDILCRLQPPKNVDCYIKQLIGRFDISPRVFVSPFLNVSQYICGVRCVSHRSTRFRALADEKYIERPGRACYFFGEVLMKIAEARLKYPDAYLFLPPLAVMSKRQFLSFVNVPSGKNIDNFYSAVRNDIAEFEKYFILK